MEMPGRKDPAACGGVRVERGVRRETSLGDCGQRTGNLKGLPIVRSVALDLAEEKGNAAERTETART